MALSARHRGRKIWPPWLQTDGSPSGAAAAQALPRLPVYTRGMPFHLDRSGPGMGARTAGQDIEDSLAGHRWGFLLERMCHDAVDWCACFEACIRWIQNNVDTGEPAWEPYSACERIANLLIFYAASPAEIRERGIPRELREFLGTSVRWVYDHLEYYGPAETNNHILNNARALVLGGIACGDRLALSAGLQIFHQCLPKLILSGGFLRERSSHYQLIVLHLGARRLEVRGGCPGIRR